MGIWLVFDAESIGIHGPHFAIGWTVVDDEGRELDAGYAGCPPDNLPGVPDDVEWVRQNVLPGLPPPTHANIEQVREAFWSAWVGWQQRGALLVSNSGWPVEARLLIACVDREPAGRRWLGPHPMHEVATARLLAGLPPASLSGRRPPLEVPEHHPLADSRQAARLWVEALNRWPRPVPSVTPALSPAAPAPDP